MYYKVVAKCGHVGKRKYLDVAFAVYSNSKKDAAKYILLHGKVKRHLKNAITSVDEISYDEYIELSTNNKNDSYIRAHCKKDLLSLNYQMKELPSGKKYKRYYEFESREERIKYLFKKDYLKGARYYDFGK